MSIDTKAARESLRLLAGGLVNAGAQALDQALKGAEQSARSTTLYRDKTGGTRKSLRRERNGFTGKLISGGATRYLENGTRPHPIEARGSGMLSFVVNGQRLFRRRVQHPGTAPRPFMQAARVEGQRDLEYALEYFTDFAIVKHNR